MENHRARYVLLGLAAGTALALAMRQRRGRRRPFVPLPGVRPRAFVTGASSGIGEVFARHLAAAGYDLVLCARREERLRALGSLLTERHGIAADVVVADLATPEGIERAAGTIAGLDRLDLLINNAGFGLEGRFARSAEARELEMVSVHAAAPVRLSRAALPGMLARGHGAIVNVSSLAGLFPLPGNVLYSSTKAFLVAFSRSLQNEVEDTGVRVQALCPGFTISEFHDSQRRFDRDSIPRILWMDAGDVVAQSLAALDGGPVVFIPGRVNRLAAGIVTLPGIAPLLRAGARRILPRRLEAERPAHPG